MIEGERPVDPICSSVVLQAKVNKALSRFMGKPGGVALPMELFDAYLMHNKVSNFTFEGDLEVRLTFSSEIKIVKVF